MIRTISVRECSMCSEKGTVLYNGLRDYLFDVPGEWNFRKCNNPDCGEAYQIDKKDYFLQIEERIKINTMSLQTPPLVCEKCGQESVFRAEKCEKCGKIFFSGAVPNDFPDRCPECGCSKTEAVREARKATRDD